MRKRATSRIVLVLTFGFSLAACYFSYTAVEQTRSERFEFRTRELEARVIERMTLYEQVLWGGVGHFNGSDSVNRDEWSAFVATLDLHKYWPGVLGLGYAELFDADEIDAHVEATRSEGVRDYQIAPPGTRDQYSSIVYLEPATGRNRRTLGYDMWTSETRQQAMAAARDTGEAIASDVVTLIHEPKTNAQRGFLTYVPVYAGEIRPDTIEDRQDTLKGWVYAPFRMGDLMEEILGTDLADVRYEVYDGEISKETLLYDSRDWPGGREYDQGPDLRSEAAITVQGQEWVIVFVATSRFTTTVESTQPFVVALGALVINLLLVYLVSSLDQVGVRANQIATEMTSELRSTKEDLEDHSSLLEAQAVQLERSNAELAQFASVASHDLQEPLRSLRSYSTLLADRFTHELGEEGDRWLGYIGTAAERMSSLIRELLDYSTINARVTEQNPVDLNLVVDRAMANLEFEIAESNLTSDVDNLPVVYGDSYQLERLFQNLISNAAKYCNSGSPHVRITSVEEPTCYRISVRDNGIGIKPEYQQRVFEMFKRVGSQTAKPGTGIGLAVCARVVEAHHGTIGVDSALGEGSTFWFTLPRSRPVEPKANGATTPARPLAVTP